MTGLAVVVNFVKVMGIFVVINMMKVTGFVIFNEVK